MGNYNGTVRCGVCWERGHNKRSCPEYTERLQREFDGYQNRIRNGESDNSHIQHRVERLAVVLGKRTGTNPLSGEAIVKRGPVRKCSYCKHKHGSYSEKGLGHTRRTCPDMKADKIEAVRINGLYREGILETFRQAGIGVGSLISMSIHGYFPDPDSGEQKWDRRIVPVMVRRIAWDSINYTERYAEPIVVQRMDQMGTSDTLPCALPYRQEAGAATPLRFSATTGEWGTGGARIGQWNPAETDGRIRLLAAVPAECVRAPDGWVDGAGDWLNTHFNGLKS
jgi:hypothetical protein